MMSPEKIVLATGGSLMATAAVLLGAGAYFHLPILRHAALWAFGAAVFVAFLPLLGLFAMLLFERIARGRRPPEEPPKTNPNERNA